MHQASSIAVAEASKVIENTQRDVNIALVNELALIFDRAGIDTRSVLEAAGSKWNFHPYSPGLVGGHCIGVDPYYLVRKAGRLGQHTDLISSARRINDGMGVFVAQRTCREMVKAGLSMKKAVVTIYGITFKEDCPDLRNSKVALFTMNWMQLVLLFKLLIRMQIRMCVLKNTESNCLKNQN